ncbi:MAG: hypothetical protein II063_10510 [Prevotella sp.]|nr:hypothetical protein [Prevotella sp.]
MKYTVWVEGYVATGERSTAHCLGTIEADNFIEAAKKLWRENYLPAYEGDPHTADDYFSINKKGIPCIWGRRCFDNEVDARKSFG